MRVHLTYDTELWCNGWDGLRQKFPAAFRGYFYGPPPQEEGALPLNLRILNDHGLKAVFFVETLFSFYFGLEPLAEIVNLILAAGQEVQLHLHPEWLDELPSPLVPPRRKTPNLHGFSREEQTTLLALGAKRLMEAGAPRPSAFRSGNYSMNATTLAALAANQFTVDSSMNAMFDFPYPPCESGRHFGPCRMGGVAEFPVTLFRDGFGRARPMQITACSCAELRQALVSARDQGLAAATIVSHNFELLSSDRSKVDRIAVRRFEKFCAWLSRHRDEFETASFDPGILRGAPQADVWPGVSPLATATRHVEQLRRRFA